MEENNGSNSKKLRNKAISLLYLLFIALVFIYVPSDFLDSINDTHRSLEQSAEQLNRLKKKKFIMYEREGFQLSIDNLVDSFKYKKIESLSDSLVNQIERTKQTLINKTGGYNEYGYPAKSKEFDVTDNLMLNTPLASVLQENILHYKTEIRPFLAEGQEGKLDSILLMKEEVLNSKGKMVPWEKFFFKKTPLSVTLMMLSKFQNEVRLVEYLTLDKYERNFLRDVFLTSGLAKVAGDTSLDNDNISADLANSDNEKLIMLNPEKTLVSLNERIKILASAKGVSVDSLGELLKASYTVNGQTTPLAIDKKGQIEFVPKKAGDYTIEAKYEQSRAQIEVKVLNPNPIIRKKDLEVLYVGIRNPLKVDFNNIDAQNIKVSADRGYLRKIDSLFYLRVSKPGPVTISVEGTQFGDSKTLKIREFQVKYLPVPYATLNSQRSGEILKRNLERQTELMIKSDVFTNTDYYTVKEFMLTRLAKGGVEVNQTPQLNKGAKFNASARALISRAKPGDMYIFNEIKVIGADGEQKELQGLVFNVI